MGKESFLYPKGDVPVKNRDVLEKTIRDNTFNSLKALIDNTYIMQKYYRLHLSLDNMAKFREFCTVRMCTARRSGHTGAIVRIMYEYFERALVLCPSKDWALRDCKIMTEYLSGTEDIKEFTAFEIKMKNDSKYIFRPLVLKNLYDNLKGYDFEAVFVDGANFLSETQELDIYKNISINMAGNDYKFFIFIQ